MTADQLKELENTLWQAADKLRVDSGLKASEYATPILGLIFLRFASIRYNRIKPEIEAELKAQKGSRMQQSESEIAIAKCGFYLPKEAQYEYLLALPEEEDIAKAIKHAMEEIEKYKPELLDSLPKDEYFKLYSPDDRTLPKSLLKIFANIPEDTTGDVFGKVYEYFLSEFALAEGQGGGEFFTPTTVVKLMVEVIEPYKGTIFDPACGSAGMFVQSSYFVDRRREELHDTDTKDLMVYGAERTPETVKLARMNIAVNGLRGEIKPANSYYEDPYNSYQKFDYVMANPPFNVDDVNLDRVKNQTRFNEYGIPQNKTKSAAKKGKEKDVNTVPNANYLWINLFATSLKPTGRAALVMANSASDARNSEADIRKNLVKSGVIDGMLTLPKNMFYTVTLPATLWFFDKSRCQPELVEGEHKILFVDARNIFRQVTRALREFTEEHIQNIAIIFRLFRGETERLTALLNKYKAQADDFAIQAAVQLKVVDQLKKEKPENTTDSKAEERDGKRWEKQVEEAEKQYKALQDKQLYFEAQIQWLNERFPNGVYEDVTGLCKAATLAEIEEQDWSMNPGRYVGVVIEEDGLTEEEFLAEMKERHSSLNIFNNKAAELEELINENLLEAKMRDWKPHTFIEVVDCNPSITIKKGEIIENCEMEDIEPNYKFLYPREGKLYKGSNAKFQNGDTVFARITPCLENGKIAQIKGLKRNRGIGSTEFFVFRGKKDISDNDFVYYLSKTNLVRDTAVNSMTGASGRQRADMKAVKKIPVLLPPLPTQQRIASFLSAYDNLIEVNYQRIKLLEETARELYKEWFVRMRFPGYKKTKFVKGVPEGWEVKELKDFGKIHTGKTPPTKVREYYGGEIPFIKTPDLHKNQFIFETDEYLTDKGNNSQKKSCLPKGSICVSCIGTGGIVGLTTAEKSQTNQQINSLIPSNKKQLEFLYHRIVDLKETIELFGGTGATMTNLSKGKFEKLKILFPENGLVEKYHFLVSPMFEHIKLLQQQNTQLRQIRDRLLPRLISGKLEVKEFDNNN